MVQQQNVWQALCSRIRQSADNCGRNADDIALLAVSKQFPPEHIRRIYAFGQRRFGENYVQEARQKKNALSDIRDISWTLIGTLQKNKARIAAEIFDMVETIDDLTLALRLSDARSPEKAPLDILIQVNISEERQKSGVPAQDALALAHAVCDLPRLRWRGFMGISENHDDPTRQYAQFMRLRECFDRAVAENLAPNVLSMGMSADLDAAIRAGSTEVRIGSALFGARNY